jgi:hypothetical protein
MATALEILAFLVVLFVIASVGRWVFRQGEGTLSVFVTIFLLIFASVSFCAASMFALTSSIGLQVLLLVAFIVTALFARAAWAG